MRTLETIRTFKTRNFTIQVDAVEDNDLDLSFDDTGEVARGLDRGDLMAFGVVVTVYLNGSEVGSDSLWNCIYKTPADFMDHVGLKAKSRQDGCNYGSYFVDLISEAISEARQTVSSVKSVYIR